jgi:hypothetical protein
VRSQVINLVVTSSIQMNSFVTGTHLQVQGRHICFLDAKSLGRLACKCIEAHESLISHPHERMVEQAWRSCFYTTFDTTASISLAPTKRRRGLTDRIHRISCAICLETVLDETCASDLGRGTGDALRLPCNHIFHRRCAVFTLSFIFLWSEPT